VLANAFVNPAQVEQHFELWFQVGKNVGEVFAANP